ncbi:hypothetical protein GTQ43_26050 [Nostoc sp. KVJ3]|uniref:hypothetical protein n=1 Tax=Nostoc sp. KVJ3 TaxID=457945 RepID=UPI002238547D|nr:hypothetical protein [Nostoc sp. KVJ3]MCW5317148.1 hypothetical protein [Nostoc sp. KVJ3]
MGGLFPPRCTREFCIAIAQTNLNPNTVQLSIFSFSLCRASCFKSENPPNALATLLPLWFVKKTDFDKEF